MTRKKSTFRKKFEHASPGELYEFSEVFLCWRAEEHIYSGESVYIIWTLKGLIYLFKLFLNSIFIHMNCNVKLKSCPVSDGLAS